MSQHHREAGLTLLEMVLATAIMALVFAITASSLIIVQQSWIKGLEKAAEIEHVLLLDRFADSQLRHLVPFSWKNRDGKQQQIFLGDRDRIIFAVRHRLTGQGSGLRFIYLRQEGEELVAISSPLPLLHWEEWSAMPLHREIIASKVQRVNFRFADFKSEEGLLWFEDWDEENAVRIPLAVQMTVEWKDGKIDSWLRRCAGSGIRENYGFRNVKEN